MSEQRILINNEVSYKKQKQTLYHELIHAYIYSYITDEGIENEEVICNIGAKSHDLIENITKEFFKKKGE